MKLTSKQRQALKGLAHDLKPVILVGAKGITDALVKETKGALLAHELIKARLAEGSADLDADAQALAKAAGATLVVRIGRMAVLYRPHPEKPRIVLPRERAPKSDEG